jgi:hypothetical protein
VALLASTALANGIAGAQTGDATAQGLKPTPLFTTPGTAAYCTIAPSSQEDFSPSLFCWTPNDGFGVTLNWRSGLAVTGNFTKPPVGARGTGVLRGYAPKARLLRAGQRFVYSCTDPRDGKGCGLSHSLSVNSGLRIVCLASGVSFTNARVKPSQCTVLPPRTSISRGSNLGGLTWSHWGSRRATGKGYELGFHLPLSHVPVTVRADRIHANRCGAGTLYTRLRVTSSAGTRTVNPEDCAAPLALAFTCRSRTSGLECANASHHGFFLGRDKGFRRF